MSRPYSSKQSSTSWMSPHLQKVYLFLIHLVQPSIKHLCGQLCLISSKKLHLTGTHTQKYYTSYLNHVLITWFQNYQKKKKLYLFLLLMLKISWKFSKKLLDKVFAYKCGFISHIQQTILDQLLYALDLEIMNLFLNIIHIQLKYVCKIAIKRKTNKNTTLSEQFKYTTQSEQFQNTTLSKQFQNTTLSEQVLNTTQSEQFQNTTLSEQF